MKKKVNCYLEDYISDFGPACRFREVGTGRLVQFKNTEGLSEKENEWFRHRMLSFMTEIRRLNIVYERTFYSSDTTEDFIAISGDVVKDNKDILQFAINKNSEFYIA